MLTVGRAERVKRVLEEPAPTEPQTTSAVPLDPKTHGPIAEKTGRAETTIRIEAPWSARAKELASAALEGSRSLPPREAIARALSRLLEAPELSGAKIGIAVEDSAGPVFAHGADQMLNPASNAKLCTAMFALGVLGPSHRFVTEVKRDGGDCFLLGAFDPSFTTETLDQIAAALVERGVREIEGDLVLDLSRFRGSRDPAGFERYGDQDWQYLARPEALAVNKNLLAFSVRPGPAVGAPAIAEGKQRAFQLRSQVKTIEPGSQFKVGIDEVDGQPIIDVFGTIALDYSKGKELVMKTPDPVASFSDELRRAFERAGIRIGGRIRKGPTPRSATRVFAHRSRPLRELLGESIATSNAFDHEMYALAAASKLAPDGRTSLKDARHQMQLFLVETLGLGAPQMANASGIGNLNRLTANDVLRLLSHASREPRYAVLLESLARPGEQGTLATRMLGTAAEGRLRAKTGTGDDAVALSGTIGKTYRFSTIVDDHKKRDGARAVVDAVGIVLAEIAARRRRRFV